MAQATDLVIEAAAAQDLPALLELLEIVHLPQDGFADHMAHALVVRGGDAVLGSAALEVYGAAALLRSVAVHPLVQGQGLGVKLVDAALDLAARQQIQRVYLLTETAADFFPKFGFTPITREDVDAAVKQSVEFTSACPQSAAVMVKKMNDE